MADKKVLVITYYWPPSGGSGVQRWLKFVKYLPAFGWKPVVFTPENPSFDVRDESLIKDVPAEAEVIRFPIWEPYSIFFKLSSLFGGKREAKPTNLVSGKNKSVFQKVSTWVRGNFIIPDPRVFWVRPSAKFLTTFIHDNKIKTVITTGPPHSIHLIGLRLKEANPSLQWIADFRDPWSEWGLLDSLMVGTTARSRHRKLEHKVLSTADKVLTITPFYVRHFERLGNRKVTFIPNGYDEDDFKNLQHVRGNNFVIRHVGIVNEKCDPRPFMNAIKELCAAQPPFHSKVKIDFVGEVHNQFRAFVQEDVLLSGITTFTPPVPHKQLIALYGTASMLLLVLHGYKDAEGYMPGKLFEYLAAGLPVIGVGPTEGDAGALLKQTKAGVMFEADQVEQIKAEMLREFNRWQGSDSAHLELRPGAARYSRRALAEELTQFLH